MKVIVGLFLGIILLTFPLLYFGCKLVGNAAGVVEKEFSPSALLKKYEEFKDLAAQLDAKRASISVMEKTVRQMEKNYNNLSREKWPRVELEAYNIRMMEIAGMKAGWNNLAAEYNARMAKANYAFCNEGDLPKGATVPLPREYRQYVTE